MARGWQRPTRRPKESPRTKDHGMTLLRGGRVTRIPPNVSFRIAVRNGTTNPRSSSITEVMKTVWWKPRSLIQAGDVPAGRGFPNRFLPLWREELLQCVPRS